MPAGWGGGGIGHYYLGAMVSRNKLPGEKWHFCKLVGHAISPANKIDKVGGHDKRIRSKSELFEQRGLFRDFLLETRQIGV